MKRYVEKVSGSTLNLLGYMMLKIINSDVEVEAVRIPGTGMNRVYFDGTCKLDDFQLMLIKELRGEEVS